MLEVKNVLHEVYLCTEKGRERTLTLDFCRLHQLIPKLFDQVLLLCMNQSMQSAVTCILEPNTDLDKLCQVNIHCIIAA